MRVSNGDDVRSLTVRIRAKRSVEDALGGMLDDPQQLLNAPKIGAGSYGHAKLLRSDDGTEMAVAKIAGCFPDLLGDPVASPFRSERIEPRLLAFLWHHLVEERRVTPHLIAPMGPHTVLEGTYTTEHKHWYPEMASSAVSFTEPASKRDMRTYLLTLNAAEFQRAFKPLMFQVLYTLAAITLRWPAFKHNDLKDDNVLLHAAPADGSVAYTVYGRTFLVPRVGVMALVADFDFATIAGAGFDNYKVLEHEWENPSLALSSRRDDTDTDVYSLITYARAVYKDVMPRAVEAELAAHFGKRIRKPFNSYKLMRDVVRDPQFVLPTLFGEGGYFDEYATDRAQLKATEHYVADVSPSLAPSMATDLAQWTPLEQRHCPLFHGADNNATFAYLYRCVPVHPEHDAEPPIAYNEPGARRLFGLVVKATERAGYDTTRVPRAQLTRATLDRFAAFLHARAVPFRWWCVLVSCALLDACHELALCTENQKGFTIAEWCDFWKDEVVYTPMQWLHCFIQWTWWRQ
jgi:hypothetical protein